MNATHDVLRQRLQRLEGRSYPAYKDLRGRYTFDHFDLLIDHVQGDPFAAPSRLRVRIGHAAAAFADDMLAPGLRQVALRDYLARKFSRACHQARPRAGSGKSGILSMDIPGQEILERSSVIITSDHLEARFTAGLPARGRRILGRAAAELLCDTVPELVRKSLFHESLRTADLQRHLHTAEDAEALRASLPQRGLVAFVADGAILPRRSGVDDRPLGEEEAVPFQSPDSLRTTMNLPHAGTITGMGIPLGVTLIVGGGFHGKSTLLQALERGIYNHVPGDGRERVVCTPTAVKIQAEAGRRVEGVDLRPFINHLPGGRDAGWFCTDNASGSTSQAANIVEALETGGRTLLLDEDTCATNLMIRDARMQQLVETTGEPITPFIDRVRQLAQRGVHSVLVLGGSGDYFDVADTVIRMDAFRPLDVTPRAHEIAARHPTQRVMESSAWPESDTRRVPVPASLDPSRGRRDVHIQTRALRAVLFGHEEVDMTGVTQLVDPGQLRAIGRAMERVRQESLGKAASDLPTLIQRVMTQVEQDGLDALDDRASGDYAVFRSHELAAALNRLRSLHMERARGREA